MTKRSHTIAKKYRGLLAVVLILTVAGTVAYEFYQSQQPSQQQNPISILKKIGVYDGNYSYVMFGSTDTNSILSSSHSTQTYVYTGTVQTSTYTYTFATGGFAYEAGEFTSSWTWQTQGFTATTYLSTASITYTASIFGNYSSVDFSYVGPICRWQQFGNGPFAWSGCKQFVLMIYNTSYMVLNKNGPFYSETLESNGTSIDWQLYFFYATYVGS